MSAPAAAAKAPPAHPPYVTMIAAAVKALKERTGSSSVAIGKYIGANYKVPAGFEKTLSQQLKRLAAAGKLVRVKASFKLSDELKKDAVKKKAVKPAAKPAAKPVAKTVVKKVDGEKKKGGVKAAPKMKADGKGAPKAKATGPKKTAPTKKKPTKPAGKKAAAPKPKPVKK